MKGKGAMSFLCKRNPQSFDKRVLQHTEPTAACVCLWLGFPYPDSQINGRHSKGP